MKSAQLFAAVVVLAVGTVVLVNAQPYSTGSVATGGPLDTYAASVGGLRLTLSISTTTLSTGQRLLIEVSELNALQSPNNVTKADAWKVSGLGVGPCYASIYPFGVAVFQGRYDSANISEARPVRVFPVVACPMLIRLISGYVFGANSASAVILPGTGPALPMRANVTVYGQYPDVPAGTPPVAGAMPLAPGIYTVAGGDEWGAQAFLYFTVK